MIARARLLAIAGSVILFVGLLAVCMAHRHSDDTAVRRSIELLLTERLKLSYRIERSVLDAAETDQSGQWWIVVSEPLKEGTQSHWSSIVEPADEAELPYYRQVVAESLSPSISLDHFKLLRGEAVLGPGSICEQLPCNIAILVRPDTRDMFVVISKI